LLRGDRCEHGAGGSPLPGNNRDGLREDVVWGSSTGRKVSGVAKNWSLVADLPGGSLASWDFTVPAPSPFQRTHGSTMVCKTGGFCRRYSVSLIVSVLAVCMLAGTGNAQQGVPAATGAASVSVSSPLQSLSASDPLLGSVPEGKLDPNPIQLTLLDALDRGLKRNLGLLLSNQNTRLAEGAKWTSLSHLLPNVAMGLEKAEAQVSLLAEGFPKSLLPGGIAILGPFSIFQVGPTLNETLNLKDYNTWKASRENIKAAGLSYRSTRDLVVLAVGASYLQAQTNASRVESVQAQVQTAHALYDQAQDLRRVGMAPGIDVLRAQVELEAEQQRLVVAENDYQKQLLSLARVIGLPPGQKFALADKMPPPAPVELSLEQAIQKAFDNRADYQRAASQVRSAELLKRASLGERMPSIGISGNYALAGNYPGNSHGTFTAAGTVEVPIFQGGKVRGDVLQADARLQQARSELEDLRSRIEYEVRTAFLDVNAASKQLEVATSALALAREQVGQSRDRFTYGVTNNVEVVQAQQAQATAEENFIAGLFAHNFAKLSLARALGIAEEATKKFLGGK
jgi:outer membrane protein TolC